MATGEKITVYYKSEFFGNVCKMEGRLRECGYRSWAQFSNAGVTPTQMTP